MVPGDGDAVGDVHVVDDGGDGGDDDCNDDCSGTVDNGGVVGDDNGNDCGVDGELERKKMCIIMMVVILTETK